ncbi:hypothetical protein D2E22_1866 [Bifidobacterium castoris]|uniref:Lipoprotein n=2 Tax=Bifidobacterium castoris TaxID=2306972 RepID=A0A430F4X0_9BIFI|nr:hypothetical protein D2E22_1866 [Bifidobacterium castoris]
MRAQLVAAAAVCALVAPTAACSAPRVEGRAESEQSVDVCETLLGEAAAASGHGDEAGAPKIARYMAFEDAAHRWLDVAIQCPARFAEGTLRSAQAQAAAHTLAGTVGASYEPLTVERLDDVDTLDIGGDALAKLALAEDRAGFATEVLAGRFADGVAEDATTARLVKDGDLLAMSDNHKETASRLMHLSDGAKDLRRKVYATQELTAHSGQAVDPATGLRANTVAILEIDCAREGLAAFDASAHIDYTAMSAQQRTQTRAALAQLSMLIATHAYTAFTLGYPRTDDVLFD